MEQLTLFLARILAPLFRPASRWLAANKRKYETWVYEAMVVGVFLVFVAAITTHWEGLSEMSWATGKFVLANWIAVIAVLGSFLQAQVGFRMAEAQSSQAAPSVYCHLWATRYWLGKELAWAAVFLLTGAYAALVGNVIFILYPAWRRIHLETRRKNKK